MIADTTFVAFESIFYCSSRKHIYTVGVGTINHSAYIYNIQEFKIHFILRIRAAKVGMSSKL